MKKLTGFAVLMLFAAIALLPLSPFDLIAQVAGTRTEPEPPPHIPNLNFDRTGNRAFAFGKRATVDGRLTIAGCGGNPCFGLIVPERLDAAGTPVSLATGFLSQNAPASTRLSLAELFPGHTTPVVLSSVALCDAFDDTPAGRRYTVAPTQNPYRCGTNGEDDCYDVTIVAALGSAPPTGEEHQMWSRPVTVRVTDPKTTAAAVAEVFIRDDESSQTDPKEKLPARSGPVFTANTAIDFLETPNVSGDGRLLLLQGGSAGIVYSLAENGARCDASQWQQFHPISHLYTERITASPSLLDDYGIAHFPLRDTEGDLYTDGDIVQGAYPWMDRSGSNLFWSRVHGVNPDPSVGGYAVSVDPVTAAGFQCLDDAYVRDQIFHDSEQAGLSFAGLWSRGKMIHLDGRANVSSYLVTFNQLDRRVNRDFCTLAQDCPNGVTTDTCNKAKADAAAVRSAGVDMAVFQSGPVRMGEARNTQLFSNEHHFNYLPPMKVLTPRDVTWVLNTSRSVMELPFDDFVSPRVLIHSDMVPSISVASKAPQTNNLPFFNDGFELDANRNVLGYTQTPRVQNAATPLAVGSAGLTPPAAGELLGGARIEPLAVGGFEGRGVYLDGDDDGIRYSIGGAGTPDGTEPWYFGIWVSPRDLDDNGTRIQQLLVELTGGANGSDGTILYLDGPDRLRLRRAVPGPQTNVATNLPPVLHFRDDAWSHVAAQGRPVLDGNGDATGATEVVLYVNGYPIHTFTGSEALIQPTAGDLIVGRNLLDGLDTRNNSLTGWVDEVVLLQRDLSFEGACNQANGTLVGTNDPAHPLASVYPQSVHDVVSARVQAKGGTAYARYFCEIHFPESDALGPGRPIAGGGDPLVCIGKADAATRPECVARYFHFPEGPIFHDAPRPVSFDAGDATKNNPFCLSCHLGSGDFSTMDRNQALTALMDLARDDARRQPLQPPQRIFGALPSEFVGDPKADPTASEHWIDCLTQPALGTGSCP